jgi:hypothetical protein
MKGSFIAPRYVDTAGYAFRVLLADQLLLLAVAAENEGWGLHDGEPQVAPRLTTGVAAALLADLVLRGRIVPGKSVTDASPTGEPDLDSALRHISGVPPAKWVRAVATDRPDLSRLAVLRAGRVLTEYDSPTARPARRLFAPEDGREVAILTGLHQAMAHGTTDRATTALLALLRATGLHERWFRGTGPKARDEALRRLTADDDWIITAVAPRRWWTVR